MAAPTASGWQVNTWVKKAVVSFPIQEMQTLSVGPFEFHDKIPLKSYESKGIRVVPHAVARHGAYIARGCAHAKLCEHWSLCTLAVWLTLG